MKQLGVLAIVLICAGPRLGYAEDAPSGDTGQTSPPSDASAQNESSQPATVQPTTPSEESSKSTTETHAVKVTNATVRDLAVGKADRSWGALAVLTHSIGSANFSSNDYVRGRNDYVTQTYDLRAFKMWEVLGKRVITGGRFIFDVNLMEPNTNPDRRVVPYDARVYATLPNIYTEPTTGISFNGQVLAFLPTSYESINVSKRVFGLRGVAGARRSVGPVDFSYSLSYTHNYNTSKVAVRTAQVARSNDPIRDRDSNGVVHLGSGYANTQFDIVNFFGVNYNVTDNFSVSYSLAIQNIYKYNMYENDALTGVNADGGRGRMDFLQPALQVSYALSSALGEAIQLPVNLSLSAGIASWSPAQSADNKTIMWPLFYNTFGQNRAANNYGSVFVDLVGTY